MADILSSGQKINDIEVSQDAPLTESLFTKMGGSINFLLDKNFTIVSFTSSSTWTCPAGVTQIAILACGGGSGGYGGNATEIPPGGSVQAGRGAVGGFQFLSVTPGLIYIIQIGAGGAAGGFSGAAGNGGTTSFNDPANSPLINWFGATSPTFAEAIADVTAEQLRKYTGYVGFSPNWYKGADFSGFLGIANGGGAGYFGPGGDAGNQSGGSAVSAGAGSGGGGGSVRSPGGGAHGNGGAGGSGQLNILYVGG